MNSQFDKKRDELLNEINEILANAEALFDDSSKSNEAELKKLKDSLTSRFDKAKQQFTHLQQEALESGKKIAKQTDNLVQENPYKAIGVAGVIGLLLGVLISRK